MHLAVAGVTRDAASDVDGVVEVDKVRRGVLVAQLERIGSIIGLFVQIWLWQVIQTSVLGMPALADFSTLVWQNRQSIPSSFAWCLWLNGAG